MKSVILFLALGLAYAQAQVSVLPLMTASNIYLADASKLSTNIRCECRKGLNLLGDRLVKLSLELQWFQPRIPTVEAPESVHAAIEKVNSSAVHLITAHSDGLGSQAAGALGKLRDTTQHLKEILSSPQARNGPGYPDDIVRSVASLTDAVNQLKEEIKKQKV